MSIIFNNASGGVNPTSEFIPYNNNGTFDDSPLWYKTSASALFSRNPITSTDEGILFDWNYQVYQFGDYNNNSKGTALVINNNTGYINTLTSGNFNGFEISDTHTIIGDVGNNFNGATLRILDNLNTIYTTLQNDAQGFRFGFTGASWEYYFGDFDGVHNGTFISVLDTIQTVEIAANTQIHLYTNDFYTQTNKLSYQEITAGSLIYTTAGGSSGKHLKIFVNGVGYKIALNNL